MTDQIIIALVFLIGALAIIFLPGLIAPLFYPEYARKIEREKQFRSSRRVVMSAIIAALYIVLTFAFDPISFGPVQFRVANILMALMFFDVDYCFGLAFGIAIANIASPFGPLDWVVMPIISLAAALLAHNLRRVWYIGIVLWALITAAGVAFFPLFLGGHIPFVATFPFILVSQVVIGFLGFSIWRPFRKLLEAHAID